MPCFDSLPDDLVEYILSAGDIQEISNNALFVSKNWNKLSWKILRQHYLHCTQEQFNAEFAFSIEQNNITIINILKNIVKYDDTKLIIEPCLVIEKPQYENYLMCTNVAPDRCGKKRGFYFYCQTSDQKIYVLIIHNEKIHETLCVTDIAMQENKSCILEYIKLPCEVDKKAEYSFYSKDIIDIIKKNCNYPVGGYLDYNDVVKISSNNDCYWGKSLLYLAIENENYSLANYLIDCMEEYSSRHQQRRYIEVEDNCEPPTKKQKVFHATEIVTDKLNFCKLKYLVNIGYDPYGEGGQIITPITKLILGGSHRSNEKEAALAKRLIRLGGEVSIIERYYVYNKLERIGYGNSIGNDETIVEELLQSEMQLRKQIYKENNKSLKQELAQVKHELSVSKAQTQELESRLTKIQELQMSNTNNSDQPGIFSAHMNVKKRSIETVQPMLIQFSDVVQRNLNFTADGNNILETNEQYSDLSANFIGL